MHSSLPDDLGIQYQSYPEGSIVAEDDRIVIFPGLGHTVRIARSIGRVGAYIFLSLSMHLFSAYREPHLLTMCMAGIAHTEDWPV